MFNKNRHSQDLYNILLNLSRNIFFYKKIKLDDTFETRILLMFFHFSILMFISKKKGKKFDQALYDGVFYNVEYNLRELGFGDVSVNKKMKDLNKILYDILLKISKNFENDQKIKINTLIVIKYFPKLKELKSSTFDEFLRYFENFYDFCFELPLDNMLKELKNYRI